MFLDNEENEEEKRRQYALNIIKKVNNSTNYNSPSISNSKYEQRKQKALNIVKNVNKEKTKPNNTTLSQPEVSNKVGGTRKESKNNKTLIIPSPYKDIKQEEAKREVDKKIVQTTDKANDKIDKLNKKTSFSTNTTKLASNKEANSTKPIDVVTYKETKER